MTCVDPFTLADPNYRKAIRLGARSGPALEVSTAKHSGWWLVAIGLAVVAAALVMGRL